MRQGRTEAMFRWRMLRSLNNPFVVVVVLTMFLFLLYNRIMDPGENSELIPYMRNVTIVFNGSGVPDLPKLLPGDVNMPDVMYHSVVLLRKFYNMQHIQLGLASSVCQHPTICTALETLIKAFGPKKHLDLDDYSFQLGILRGRQLAREPRPTSCHGCMAHNFNTLIAPKDICKKSNTSIELLLILTTIPQNIDSRNALRETWLKYSENNTGRIRHLFLIGGGWPEQDLQRVRQESEIYGDILVEDYKDAYYNLSYKVHGGFRWAVNNCFQAKFLSRCADDIYLNVPKTLTYLKENRIQLNDTVIGTCWSDAMVDRVWQRHYQSRKDYPPQRFGPYCDGKTTIMPMSATKKLVDVAPDVPYFNLEDHWVGFAGEKAKLKIKNVPGFNVEYYPKPDINAYFDWRKQKGVCNFDKNWYNLHRVTAQDIRNVHSECIGKKLR